MSDQPKLVPDRGRFLAPVLPLAVIVGLLIFVGTYFVYFERHRTHAPGSYAPMVIGLGAFYGVMLLLNYLALPSQSASTRFAKATGIAMAETGAFFVLLMLLILNTLGA